jgi:hypothetical protein
LTHLLSSCCFAAGSFLRSSCCRNNLTCTSTWEGHQRGFQKKAKQPQLPGLGPPIMALKALNNEAVISAARSIIIWRHTEDPGKQEKNSFPRIYR